MAKDMDEEGKKTHIKLTKNIINDVIRNRFAWIKNCEIIYVLMSFVSMLYSIYVLIEVQMATFDRAILTIYASIFFIINLPLLIISAFYSLLFLGVIGILILGFCFAKKHRAGQFIDLKPKDTVVNTAIATLP